MKNEASFLVQTTCVLLASFCVLLSCAHSVLCDSFLPSSDARTIFTLFENSMFSLSRHPCYTFQFVLSRMSECIAGYDCLKMREWEKAHETGGQLWQPFSICMRTSGCTFLLSMYLVNIYRLQWSQITSPSFTMLREACMTWHDELLWYRKQRARHTAE